MPYKKPLCEKGVRERPYAHFIKLCWFEIHFKDIHNEISFRKFCKNFQQIIGNTTIIEDLEAEYNLEWNYYNEDGSLKEPNYEDIKCNKWRKKYKYSELYKKFKADKLGSTEMSEREKYIRNMAKLNTQDYKLLDRCYEKEEEYTIDEMNGGKDKTYYRNKNNDTISNIDERLRKRNNLTKETHVLEGNINADVNNHNETVHDIDSDVLKVLADAVKRRNHSSD